VPEHVKNIEILFCDDDEDLIINDVPYHIKQIKINQTNKIHCLKKIPFDCKIVDEDENEIFIE
jgi:hypothetical protein